MMNKISHLAIVGAGPAGASAAIRLAQKGFRIILIERERFPRQKLCGEFISPECFRHFRALGVFEEMLAAGGERIVETAFYAANGKRVGVPSKWFNDEGGALSLSRAEMDFRLLERAKSLGVEILEEFSVVNLSYEKDEIRAVNLRARDGGAKEIFADLFVDATGRARVLGKLAEKQKFQIPNTKSQISNRLVGFKTHLENVSLERGVCEIYFFRGGYGGLSYVENGLANFCFLVRADVVREFSSDAEQIIENLIFQNKRAAETLSRRVPVRDWLAVSVDGFGEKNLRAAKNLFAVGDAGAFIDPFTGSGMLMALESAEILAAAIVENYSAETIAEKYKTEHARRFGRRLFVCSLLRRAAFAPALAQILILALSVGNTPRKFLARATRPREV
jgi:flavin-dependent dehydrogenase